MWSLAPNIIRAISPRFVREIRPGPRPQIGSYIEAGRLFFGFEAYTTQEHLFPAESMLSMTLIGGRSGAPVSAQRYLGRQQISMLKGKILRFTDIWDTKGWILCPNRSNRFK